MDGVWPCHPLDRPKLFCATRTRPLAGTASPPALTGKTCARDAASVRFVRHALYFSTIAN